MVNYNPLTSLLDTVKGNLRTLREEASMFYRGIYASGLSKPELPVEIFDDTGRPATKKEISLYPPDLGVQNNPLVPDQGDDLASIVGVEADSDERQDGRQ